MWQIKHIFETTSRREMIDRFIKASKMKFFVGKKMPHYYEKGLTNLTDAVSPVTYISKKDVFEALRSFTISESKSDLYGKLFSKIGKVICFFLLSNRHAMENEIQSITLTPIPQRFSVRGALQQTGRAVVVATGLLLTFVPQTRVAGYALTHSGQRLPVDDAMVDNPEIKNIIEKFNSVDFEPLYQKIS